MLNLRKPEATAFLNSMEEVEAWLEHQRQLDPVLNPQRAFIEGCSHTVVQKERGGFEVVRKYNGIVNAGYDFIAGSIADRTAGAAAAIGWVAIGSSATAFNVTQTALSSETARVARTYLHTAGTKIFSVAGQFSPGTGTGSVNEAGCFNAATSGTMLDRVVFSTVNKAAGDYLYQTFVFTMT